MHLANNKIYFALISILVRQQHSLKKKRFVAWLDEVKGDASYFSSG
jgi:hypothetical protein